MGSTSRSVQATWHLGRKGFLGWVCAAVLLGSGCQKGGSPEATDPGQPAETPPASAGQGGSPAKSSPEVIPTGPAPTAQGILEAMVAAYKQAKTYSDQGTIRIRATEKGKPVDQPVEYSLVWSRPDKVHLTVYRGVIVSDGKDFWGYAQDLPGQVVKRAAPGPITVKSLLEDPVLMDAISQGPTLGFSRVPLQALLLLAEDPLKTVLHGAKPPVLLEPAKIGPDECHRVELERSDGKAVLWIDRQSSVLRRVEFPIEEINRSARQEGAEVHSLVADFSQARFDAAIDEKAFQFDPEGARTLDQLVMPALLLLGRPAPEFSFVGLDGTKVTPKSLEGKIAVLEFWTTTCAPCRSGFPLLQKVAQKYKDNPKVAFLAVSVDPPEVPDKDLRTMLDELRMTWPVARDPKEDAGRQLQLRDIPSTCIVNAKGVVEDFSVGFPKDVDAELSRKVEALLAGRSIHEEPFRLLAEDRKQYAATMEKWIAKGLFVGPSPFELEIPEIKVAEATKTKAFALTRLWTCSDVKGPANLLVVPQSAGPARLFVIDIEVVGSVKSVVQLGPDGKVLARHKLDLDDKEAVTFLRTAVDASGKRYFAASGPYQQRVHVFDENWKVLAHYPANALEPDKGHAGIVDAQFADLDADGTPELVVGYARDVGVHAVSLDGKQVWRNRSVVGVLHLAVLGQGAGAGATLLCANEMGSLVLLDGQGKPAGQIRAASRTINWIVAADLGVPNKTALCALAMVEPFTQVALGLGPNGEELWSYPLPKGVFERAPEQVVAGRLFLDGPGQWILPGADGSIHVLGPDGKLIDQFNYGASLSGLATTVIDNQPVLVVATKDSVEAWKVQVPAPDKR